jgi:Peptidase family M28
VRGGPSEPRLPLVLPARAWGRSAGPFDLCQEPRWPLPHERSPAPCPAANDNGSGVAALLELARRFAEVEPARMIRFVCCKRRQ